MHAAKLVGLAVLLAGCPDRTISAVPIDQGKVEVMDIPAVLNNKIDLLFVIDSSKSMEDEQASLRANFSRMIAVLETIRGGLPDVHIGVITPDLGTGAVDGTHAPNIFTCANDGQDGKLRELTAGGVRFLESRDDGAGGRVTNFPGLTLTDAFAQIADVGVNGCGVEQHLEAMKRATDGSNAENANFLRDDAFLAVILIADEDDCSLAKSSLFDGDTNDPAYGERVNFRCTQEGVACDTPSTPFDTAGPREDCHPRTDATELTLIDRYVAHLESLKPDPRSIIVAGILGDAEPFVIEKRAGVSVLGNACPTASGNIALPAVRMSEVVSNFTQSTLSTICDDDLSDGLEEIGELITGGLDPGCFANDLLDVDPVTAGSQFDCSVVEVRRRAGQSDEELRTLAPCETGRFPCWRVEEDAVKCFFTDADPHLKLVIDYNGELPGSDIHIKTQCVTTESGGPVL